MINKISPFRTSRYEMWNFLCKLRCWIRN